MTDAATLNADCNSALLDWAGLQGALLGQGSAWYEMVRQRCPHLFAEVPVFISSAQLRQMHDVISAVENVVRLEAWNRGVEARYASAKGVFYGYDFHLNEQGAHLIEINTNAGGAFFNELLIDSQRAAALPGKCAAIENLARSLVLMFRNEWRLERGSAPLKSLAITDEQPEGQYLYPEFLIAQRMLEQDGLLVRIVDPSMFSAREAGLFLGDERIDMVYNRLTDFSLQWHPELLSAYASEAVVLTPSPVHFARYADKRNLVRLTDAQGLRKIGAMEEDIAILEAGIPLTVAVRPDMRDQLWAERRHWFFKPVGGYGSKGTYRGEKLTKGTFAAILNGDYVAQKLAAPGERAVCWEGSEPSMLKYDVRCFVYDGQIQCVVARLYQGQTTNFRTPGGGFALVRVVE